MSRLIIDIANDAVLGPEFVMRGGTCLHKIHLAQALRYSEDLDYNRRTHSGIKPLVDAIERIATNAGLRFLGAQRGGDMFSVHVEAPSTSDAKRTIRIKVETNIHETTSCYPTVTLKHTVSSSWWSGEAQVPTFELAELMGTKIRALYQRSKGRDLFDLWLALTQTDVSDARIVGAFEHYLGAEAFTYPQLAQNLRAKLKNPEFNNDLRNLLTATPTGYDIVAAADLFMERLGSRLRNAPSVQEISGGKWRP